MTPDPTTARRRRIPLALGTIGVAMTLAACGGSPASPSQSASPTGAGASASAPGASGTSTVPAGTAMSTYPPVTPGPAATGPHNDTDALFANDMIPHHGQAVLMADMILAKTGNPDVAALARQIKAAQTPEIVMLSGWLTGWGQTPPDPYARMDDDMAGMDHSGMMSNAQLDQLAAAVGTAADKMFLSHMVDHHEGAIDMARTQLAQGASPEAKTLAQSIITSQTAEITRMKTLLAGLG